LVKLPSSVVDELMIDKFGIMKGALKTLHEALLP